MNLARCKFAAWFVAVTLASGILEFPAMGARLNLQSELGSDLFSFFHLVPVGTPTAVGGSQAWHSFRPSGPDFHDLVEVDILAGADSTISMASIGLDRSFISDPRNAVFARDIAKSFLAWAVRNPSPQISNLIANLADLSGAGRTIIARGPAPPPPPPDTTGAYGVFLGREQRASIADTGVTLNLYEFSRYATARAYLRRHWSVGSDPRQRRSMVADRRRLRTWALATGFVSPTRMFVR